MKKLLLFLLSISLLGGHALGMKRKRQDDDDGSRIPKKRKVIKWVPIKRKRKKKKGIHNQYLGAGGKYYCPDCGCTRGTVDSFRKHLSDYNHGHYQEKVGRQPKKIKKKKVGVYDQYLGEDGKYHCPDCKSVLGSINSANRHMSLKRHGHFKQTNKRSSLYDQYLGKDGLYRCPESGCNYVAEKPTALQGHMVYLRHAHLKKEKRKKKSVCDRYLKKDGTYQCPDCGYQASRLDLFRAHLSSSRHGYLKEKQRKKSKKEGVYEQYRKEDDLYHCPDCTCKSKSVSGIRSHFSTERHGHLKEKRKRKNKEAGVYEQYLVEDDTYQCPDCKYVGNSNGIRAHMWKHNHGHLKEVDRKESVYEQYRDANGRYCCPDCGIEKDAAGDLAQHLSRYRHGHFRGKAKKAVARKARKSVYDQYLGADDKYRCPDCTYEGTSKKNFGCHLISLRHGHLKGVKKKKAKKRNSIFDQYVGTDGMYHCPDCDYKKKKNKKSLLAFKSHLRIKGHGHRREIDLETIVPQESISVAIDENGCCFKLTVRPVLRQQNPNGNSLSYALFNAVCMLTNDIDLMYNQKKLDAFLAASQGKVDAAAIIKNNKLLRPLKSNLVVIYDVSMFDFVEIDKNGQEIIILNLGRSHWIAIKLSCQNGENKVEIVDALYQGFEDLGKLTDIAKRLM